MFGFVRDKEHDSLIDKVFSLEERLEKVENSIQSLKDFVGNESKSNYTVGLYWPIWEMPEKRISLSDKISALFNHLGLQANMQTKSEKVVINPIPPAVKFGKPAPKTKIKSKKVSKKDGTN